MVAGRDLEEVSDQGEGFAGPEAGEEKSIVILNRVLEWRNEGIAIEADPRHVELILHEMGIQSEVMGPPPNPTDEILLTGADIDRWQPGATSWCPTESTSYS